MNIGVDFDEPVFPFFDLFCKFLSEKYGKEICTGDVKEYNLWENIALREIGISSAEIAIRIVEEFCESHSFKNSIISDELVNILKKFKGDCNKLFVVSGRSSLLEEETRKYAGDHPELFNGYYFTNHYYGGIKRKKPEVLHELKCTLHVEDNYESAKEIVEAGITVFLYLRPWNERKELIPGMISVRNWDDIWNVYSFLKHF